MLTAIVDQGHARIHARDASRQMGPFHCSSCLQEVILHKGRIRIPHFAHKPGVYCPYSTGESEAHRHCKQSIFDALSASPSFRCELEKPLSGVRPDIWVYTEERKQTYAIEVQISSLTMDEIIRRTKRYYDLDIYVLWLPLLPKFDKERFAPRSWEKWLHALYFGRVYYWLHGQSVVRVAFKDYELYVEEYNNEYEGISVGGYSKRSKRWRTPDIQKVLTLDQSFKGKTRNAWQSGNINVPKSMILIDD